MAYVRAGGSFAVLPDELVLAILRSFGRLGDNACFGATCWRMQALASDKSLWEPLFMARFKEPPLHEHFAAFGKTWPWVYRAHIRPAELAAPSACPF